MTHIPPIMTRDRRILLELPEEEKG